MLSFLNARNAIAKPGFNRWRIPAAAMALQLCLGQAYALNALYLPLSGSGAADAARAWLDGRLLWVFTLAIIMLGLSAAVGGRLTVAIGARATAFIATVLFCSGMAVAGLAIEAENAVLLYASYGIVSGIGLGLGYVAPIQLLVDWFPDRRGLATGLAITGFGGGAILATPLSSALIGVFQSEASSGVGHALIALALIYAVIMLAACRGFRHPPMPQEADEPALDAGPALRTPQFYMMWVLLFINVVTGINLLSSAPDVLALAMGRGAMAVEIAGFVALLGVSNMAGRFLIAAASDYLVRNHTVALLALAGSLLHLATPMMAARLNLPLTVLAFMLMTMVYGGLFAIVPAYISDVFGKRRTGAIHGNMLTAWSVGGLLAAVLPQLLGAGTKSLGEVRDLQLNAFYVSSLLFLVAFIINMAIHPVVGGTPAPEEGAAAREKPIAALERWALHASWVPVGLLLLAGIGWTLQKSMALPLSWQIGATLLPLLLGAAVCVAFYYLDRTRFAVRGVAGPYFAALALIFGLYASLMTGEVWQKISRVNDLLDTQVSALQSLASISQSVAPGDTRVLTAVKAYADALAANDRLPPVPEKPLPGLQAPLQQLYAIGADADFFKGHAPQNSSFMSALETLRFAHLERSKLRVQGLDAAKLVSLLIFGLLTQIAIAFCHAGNQRAISTTVMLFSVSFSVAVAVMALLDGAIRFADAAHVIPYLGALPP